MNKDTVVGGFKEEAAKLRGKVDHAVGDTKGEALAKADEISGNTQKNAGKMKDAIKNAANS